jgi:hypothetical protein
MPPRWSLLLLGLFLLIGAVLRGWQAGDCLWVDELHSAWVTHGSLAEVAPRAAIGNQSPLFFWLQWLVVNTLGASEFTLRLPSLIAGCLLPAALFGVTWRWTQSGPAALVAAALAVVDPRAIFYATEARPYALVELLAVLHVALFAELLARPSPRLRVAFVLGAALLFHLHYTAALLIAAEFVIWLLVAAVERDLPYRFTMCGVDLFFIAALAAPAVWNVAAIAGRRENWASFVEPQPAAAMLTILPWSGLVLLVLVDADAFVRTVLRGGPRDECRLLVLLGWLIVPVAATWLLTETGIAHVFAPRYLIASAPAAIVLAALVTRLPPWPQTRMTVSLVFVAYALWSSAIIPQFRAEGRFVTDRREDWRGAVAWLNERHAQTPLPVLVRSGFIEADELRHPHAAILDEYCLLPVTSLYRLKAEREDLLPLPFHEPGKLETDVQSMIRERGGAWLINRTSPNNAAATARRIAAGLQWAEPRPAGRGGPRWQVLESKSFGNIQVLRIVKTSGT